MEGWFEEQPKSQVSYAENGKKGTHFRAILWNSIVSNSYNIAFKWVGFFTFAAKDVYD